LSYGLKEDIKAFLFLSAQPACSEESGAAPLSGAGEQTALTISAYAQYAIVLSLQMGV
jgi:hypothetical protein